MVGADAAANAMTVELIDPGRRRARRHPHSPADHGLAAELPRPSSGWSHDDQTSISGTVDAYLAGTKAGSRLVVLHRRALAPPCYRRHPVQGVEGIIGASLGARLRAASTGWSRDQRDRARPGRPPGAGQRRGTIPRCPRPLSDHSVAGFVWGSLDPILPPSSGPTPPA